MRKSFLPAVTLALVAFGTFAGAQSRERPDVSGNWAADPTEAPATLLLAPSPVMGARLSLKVTGSTLVLGRPMRDTSMISTYPIDGTTVASRVPGRLCEGERTFHEAASWEGDALVLATVGLTPAGGGAMIPSRNRSLIRLEAPDRLVIEGTMMQEGQRKQVGTVYKRSIDPLPAPRPAPAIAGIAATIAHVAWIGASWAGTTGQVTTEERWTPPASGGMMATARTLRGPNLSSFEFLCIAERDGSLAYIAMPDGRTPPTLFMLTAITPSSATFENPAHDYPKIIRYTQTPDGSLETTIAGANMSRAITVPLKKQVP